MIRLPAGTAANKELARDLGQFTIDGGVLIIGVDEGDETTPPSLTPMDLARLTKRIEEVAAKPGRPPAARPHPDHRGGRPAWYGLRAVANTTDWLGSWDFGVAVTGLRGLTSFQIRGPWRRASGPGPASGRRRGQVGRPEGPGGPG
jgi:hypothetical protein